MLRTDSGDLLAQNVEIADTVLHRFRGYMFRREPPESHAIVFDLGRRKSGCLHMLFVGFPVTAAYLNRERRVTKVTELEPWVGFSYGRARYVVELPGRQSGEIEVGGKLRF